MNQPVDSRTLTRLQATAEQEGRQCVVGAVVINEQGQAFAQKRAASRRLFPNCWDLIGGHVEAGETLVEALRREIREETGWELSQIVSLLAVFDWEDGQGELRREMDFLVEVTGDLAHPQLEWSKNSAFRWLSLDELDILKENRQPQDSIIFEIVKQGLESLPATF